MINITYHFKFPKTGEDTLTYHLGLDEDTFQFIPLEKNLSPTSKWANLDFHQCKNCPLKKEQSPTCPVASNLFSLVYYFHTYPSYKQSMIFIETADRSYAKNASIQEGLYSIFGIIMATSGCQHLNFLRPMARFHLPFASAEETIFRAAAFFLLGDYLKNKGSNVSLEKLKEKYQQVQIVNQGILQRIRNITKADADLNALVILDNFAQMISLEMSNDFSGLLSYFKE